MNDYERIRNLFEQVLDAPESERRDHVVRLAGSDDQLRAAMLRMLSEDVAAEQEGFLAEPLFGGRFLLGSHIHAEHAPLPTIRGYEVTALIATGSSGIVYKAEASAPLSRTVAIKVVRAGMPEDMRPRFAREQQALARLNHPCIAQVYDAGETDDGRLFVAVEFVNGPWITRYADEHSLDWQQRVDLVIQVCEAVHVIHMNGLMHRDLKPANILVSDIDGKPSPKVIDFGASALVDPLGWDRTEGPRLLGTIAYMAPEQLKHGERGDVRMDVFALGIIAFELLTGHHPYGAHAAPLAHLVRDLTEKSLPRISASFGSDRLALQAVLAKATAKNAAQRYASAQHFGEDLRRLRARLPVEANPSSLWRDVHSLLRRYPKATLSGCAAALVIIMLAVASVRSAQKSTTRANEMAGTVSALTDDVLAEIEELSGADSAKENLASLLLLRLDAMPSDLRGADFYTRRAEVLWSLAAVAQNRGDSATALQLRLEAREGLQKSRSSNPGEPSTEDSLSHATILIGDAQYQLGRRDEALANYQAVHQVLKNRLAASPGDVALMDELTWSYERLIPFAFAHSPEDAASLQRERLALAERLYSARHDDVMATFALGAAHAELASVTRRLGDPVEGEHHGREAKRLLADAASDQPHRLAFRLRELTANLELARSLLEQDSREAVGAMQHTTALARTCFAENPGSEAAWLYRSTILEQAIVLFEHFGERDSASSARSQLEQHHESPLSDRTGER